MDLEIRAAEIKLRAKRRIGEITSDLPKAQGARRDKPTSPHGGEKSKKEVLTQAGLSTQEASRCEHLASIPEKDFNEMVQQIAEEQKSVSARIVVTAIQRAEKEQERQERREMNIEKIAAFTQDTQPLDAQFATIVLDPPSSLRVTPAMEAGVSNYVWSLEEMVNLIA